MDAVPLDTSYAQRLIAFIDVLGFGSLVAESGKNAALERKAIRRVSDAVLWSLEELEELLSPSGDFVFTQFSDSFVVSVDAGSADRHGLSTFAFAILSIVDCFLGSRLLLRGGISRGQLIHNKRLLFGPAMNRAYELESRLARVPRIILDPALPELAGTVVPMHTARDTDGVLYVDYFTPQKAFYLVPSWSHAIQQAIEAIPASTELREKREWLIEKHNAVIGGFSYDAFKARLDDYVNDTDSNNAVVEDYDQLLRYAKQLRKFQAPSA